MITRDKLIVYDNSFYWSDVARLQGVDERNVYLFVFVLLLSFVCDHLVYLLEQFSVS